MRIDVCSSSVEVGRRVVTLVGKMTLLLKFIEVFVIAMSSVVLDVCISVDVECKREDILVDGVAVFSAENRSDEFVAATVPLVDALELINWSLGEVGYLVVL